MNKKPKVAIIGAGLAGLSAAVYLHKEAEVHLFEAGTVCGGRTRTLARSSDSFKDLDNGQHILLGSYQSTLNFLKQINIDQTDVFFRSPLKWWMDNGFQLNCSKICAPLNLIMAILFAQKLDFKSKILCLRDLLKLKLTKKEGTVQNWLEANNVAPKLQQDFWCPLVLATLNTPISEASIITLKYVADYGLLERQNASDLLLPARPLKEIFVNPALKFLSQNNAKLNYNYRVKTLIGKKIGEVFVDEQPFDAAILAVAPFHAKFLLHDESIKTLLDSLQYAAICTVYLRYKENIALPFPMVGIAQGMAQWLFDRGALVGAPNEVAAVISCVPEDVDKALLIQEVHKDVLKWLPNLSYPVDFKIIIEKRATFKSTTTRPKLPITPPSQEGVYLAGDYMHPYFPATIEGAIQSGQTAADRLLLDWKNNEK